MYLLFQESARMDGRSNPGNQFGSSRENKQPSASKQDSAGIPQPKPHTSGTPIPREGKVTHHIPKKEAQVSGRDIYSGTGQHAGPVFKSFKSPEYPSGDFKTITIENVASIPLPTEAPPISAVPPKPVLTTTTVITPSLPPQVQKSSAPQKSFISSIKVEQEGSPHKFEGSKPSSCHPSAPTITTSTTSVKSKSILSTGNVSGTVNQPQKSTTISGIDTVREASARLFPLEGSSSKELTSSKGLAATEPDVASKLASTGSFFTSAVTHTQPSEGLSSLVSYSSSSAEASASEDNAQDDQEDSSSSSVVDEPMDTNESSSQFVGALPKVMGTEPYVDPEEIKKADSQELPRKIQTVPYEAHAKTSESNQEQVVSVKSPDTVKERDPQPAQSKTIVKESTEVQPDCKKFSDKRDTEDIKLASNTSLTLTAESKDEQQASVKIPTTVKESISDVCPPKPSQQKAADAADSEQVISASLQDKKGEKCWPWISRCNAFNTLCTVLFTIIELKTLVYLSEKPGFFSHFD